MKIRVLLNLICCIWRLRISWLRAALSFAGGFSSPWSSGLSRPLRRRRLPRRRRHPSPHSLFPLFLISTSFCLLFPLFLLSLFVLRLHFGERAFLLPRARSPFFLPPQPRRCNLLSLEYIRRASQEQSWGFITEKSLSAA